MWIEEMVWNREMWILQERMDGEEGAKGGGGFKGATSGEGVAACARLLTRLRESPVYACIVVGIICKDFHKITKIYSDFLWYTLIYYYGLWMLPVDDIYNYISCIAEIHF
jgi:hypothetical protein